MQTFVARISAVNVRFLSPFFIFQIINGWLREGVIICPPCEEVCRPEHFSPDEKFAYCQETGKDEIPEYIGDAPMDEPCAASPLCSGFILLFILISLCFQVFG